MKYFIAALTAFYSVSCFAQDTPPLPADINNEKDLVINTKSIILADASDINQAMSTVKDMQASSDSNKKDPSDTKKAAQDHDQEQPVKLPPRTPIKPADNPTYKNALSAPSKVQIEF